MWIWVLWGCGDAPIEPEQLSIAAQCSRVYGSTTDTLAQMYAASTEPEPPFTRKSEWINACVKMELTEAQLRCADPKIQMLDPTCEITLNPVRDRVQALQDQLIAQPRSQP